MDEDKANLLTVSFNQDAKSLAVGYDGGFSFYSPADAGDMSLTHCESDTSPQNHDAIIVERLFNSSLIAVVSRKKPRVMHVYHFSTKNMICDHSFKNSILSIRINRERIVVCIEDCLHIYNLRDMKLIHSIMDTPLNRMGVIDLCATGSCLLAYPGSSDVGKVHLFNSQDLTAVNAFSAHDGPIAALKFNPEGTMLATASTKGTVIRVLSIPHGSRLFEFRRGMSRCVSIYSLAFSPDSMYLCSTSNTETVHVFKLVKPEDEKKSDVPESSGGGWFDYIRDVASQYVPNQVHELITVERSFATARLPGQNRKSIAALPIVKNQQYLLVATTDGFLYSFKVDSNGGECESIRQQTIGPRIDGQGSDSPAGRSPASPSGAVQDSPKGSAPNTEDLDEFPPMSHSSG